MLAGVRGSRAGCGVRDTLPPAPRILDLAIGIDAFTIKRPRCFEVVTRRFSTHTGRLLDPTQGPSELSQC